MLNFSGERETAPERQSNGSVTQADSGSGSVTRVREESGPCVALLVCLVNKWVKCTASTKLADCKFSNFQKGWRRFYHQWYSHSKSSYRVRLQNIFTRSNWNCRIQVLYWSVTHKSHPRVGIKNQITSSETPYSCQEPLFTPRYKSKFPNFILTVIFILLLQAMLRTFSDRLCLRQDTSPR